MQYTREDIARARERYENNAVSLNKAVRQAENAQLLERKKAMDAERKTRYEQMAADDAKNLTICNVFTKYHTKRRCSKWTWLVFLCQIHKWKRSTC